MTQVQLHVESTDAVQRLRKAQTRLEHLCDWLAQQRAAVTVSGVAKRTRLLVASMPGALKRLHGAHLCTRA